MRKLFVIERQRCKQWAVGVGVFRPRAKVRSLLSAMMQLGPWQVTVHLFARPMRLDELMGTAHRMIDQGVADGSLYLKLIPMPPDPRQRWNWLN